MDRRSEIRDFLISRRARIPPEQAGLKVSPLSGARRVASLRAEVGRNPYDKGLSEILIVCSVAPGSRDADALSLLASWSAGDRTRQSVTPGQP